MSRVFKALQLQRSMSRMSVNAAGLNFSGYTWMRAGSLCGRRLNDGGRSLWRTRLPR
jgi:hypothetical protein